MTPFQIIAVILSFTAIGGYVNYRYLRLPATIGNMAFALLLSVLAIALGELGWLDLSGAVAFVSTIDFSAVLLHGMLSFLLFAAALHIRIDDLRSVRGFVAVMATLGVGLATLVTGTLLWWAATLVGLHLPYLYALLFGALVSPTDPIAALAMLKQANISKALYAKIGGESLFNDGIGVVAFLTILGIATSAQAVGAADILTLLAREAGGGIALGLLLGWATHVLMRPVDDYKIEVLLTLGLVTGGYVLAEGLGVSAPICMVVTGLFIGNHRHSPHAQERPHKQLDMFWELLDEIMNAVLFMLIGLEILVIPLRLDTLWLGLLAVGAVLAGRAASVALPVALMGLRQRFERGTIPLLVWGGLRGGLSIAMALSLPPGPQKDIIIPVTYIVVLFSIFVQGLTFPHLVALLYRPEKDLS